MHTYEITLAVRIAAENDTDALSRVEDAIELLMRVDEDGMVGTECKREAEKLATTEHPA